MADSDGVTKMFIFSATPDFLAKLLRLPKGATVDHVWSDPAKPGTVLFRCRGAGFPIYGAEIIPQTTAMIVTVPQSLDPADDLFSVAWPFDTPTDEKNV